jgi:hypothetical protein
MSAMAWSRMGAKPFEDTYMDAHAAGVEEDISKS